MLKHLAILSLVLVVLFGATYAIIWVSQGVERYDALANFGVATYGWVVKKEPHNHNTITYSYVVDNVQYTGIGGAGSGKPDFEQLQIGDKVIVYYDVDNPIDSFLGYPQYKAKTERSFSKEVAGILTVFLFLPLAGVYIGILLAMKAKKSKVAQASSSK